MFTYKFDESGYLTRYKARVVAKDDLEPLSGEETYAAILVFCVFRTLMALAAAYNLTMRQMDAVNTFLNAKLKRPIYCRMPSGFEIFGFVLWVIMALYGLRKSPLLWLQEFSTTLKDFGLVQIPREPCLWIDYRGLILFFFVDDIAGICIVVREADLEAFLNKLKGRYQIKDLGTVKWFLNIRVIQDRQQGKIWLYQDLYIDKIISDYKININKSLPKIPMLFDKLINF